VEAPAPARSSSRTTAAWPPAAARCSAVLPACSSAGGYVRGFAWTLEVVGGHMQAPTVTADSMEARLHYQAT
jgi:hypothetical protein